MLSLRVVVSMLSVIALGVGVQCAAPAEAARHRSSAHVHAHAAPTVHVRTISEADHQSAFVSFMKAHNKEYTADEVFARYSIFKANHQQVVQHNAEAAAGQHSWTMGINHMSDLSAAEFTQRLSAKEAPTDVPSLAEWETLRPEDWVGAPDSLDWRTNGTVTSVKDQGDCGACWAFATVAVLESACARVSGNLTSLSEQQLVDCTSTAHGCDGGQGRKALTYLTQAGGIAGEDDYPYLGVQSGCQGVVHGARCHVSGGYQSLPQDEGAMRDAVAAVGVVGVMLDSNTMQHYAGGVFTGCTSTKHNHEVGIVGYGADIDHGHSFWIIKNSWGPNWGEKGYIRLQRGVNMCGVNQGAFFATNVWGP